MKKKLSIAVIYGGVSGEHEVSLQSAASVMKALDKSRYDIIPILIDKKGNWFIKSKKAKKLSSLLAFKLLGSSAFDVVIPLVHGTGGEDGALQGLLELSGVPYVGSGVLGSAVGMDKVIQKKILERDGLPVAPFMHFKSGEWTARPTEIMDEIAEKLGYPAFVKPANLGSSVGISKAHHRKELKRGIEDALRYDTKVIIETAVPEAREIECAVLGNDDPKASLLGEIMPSNEFYDYEAKYLSGKSETSIPAELPKALENKIRKLAIRTFTILEASGLARVDFFVNRSTGEIFVNEINTIPGFTSISMYPKLWEASGLTYGKLLDNLIVLALERVAQKRRLKRSFSPAL